MKTCSLSKFELSAIVNANSSMQHLHVKSRQSFFIHANMNELFVVLFNTQHGIDFFINIT